MYSVTFLISWAKMMFFVMPPTPHVRNIYFAGLAKYKAGMARKSKVTVGPNDVSRPKDPAYLGTPRSVRFENLFAGAKNSPNLFEVFKRSTNSSTTQ